MTMSSFGDLADVENGEELVTGMREMGDVRGVPTCRLVKDYPPFLFRLHSCALCYQYLRDVMGMFGQPSKKWKTTHKLLRTRDGYRFGIAFITNKTQNQTETPITVSY